MLNVWVCFSVRAEGHLEFHLWQTVRLSVPESSGAAVELRPITELNDLQKHRAGVYQLGSTFDLGLRLSRLFWRPLCDLQTLTRPIKPFTTDRWRVADLLTFSQQNSPSLSTMLHNSILNRLKRKLEAVTKTRLYEWIALKETCLVKFTFCIFFIFPFWFLKNKRGS